MTATKPSVLCVHNFYQKPGGEDQVFANESALLEAKGHRVERYEEDNARIGSSQWKAGLELIWSRRSHAEIGAAVRRAGAGVAHFHNTYPLISPSAYYAARGAGAAVVQTLHNYRLVCPAALLLREGSPCEECLGRKTLLPSVKHACYRGSRVATSAIASMITVHRAAGTYRDAVDLYVALSEFARSRFIAGGLPAERIVVKPNFTEVDPGIGVGSGRGRGDYALFVGRTTEDKGVRMMSEAWAMLPDIGLTVAGEGPLGEADVPACGAKWVGWQSREQVVKLMQDAAVLIFPSLWYESAPMTIVEAFACGLPVIASRLGSIPEFVEHGKTGLLFAAGDAEDLARQVRWAFAHPDAMAEMRVNARREYEAKYTAERNYKMLMAVYEQAMENAAQRRRDREAS